MEDCYWRGKKVSEMSIDELREAFYQLGYLYNKVLQDNIRRWK